MFNRRLFFRILPSLLTLSLTACIGGSTPPARFYLLEPMADVPVETVETGKPLLVLAPVRIPRYLDRAQIVTATGDNSYQLSELNRWAEGLDYNIGRVLQQDLAKLVPAEVVMSAPAGTSPMKLAISILEFHVDAHGQAGLTVQWQLSRDNQLLVQRQQNYRESASREDYGVMVAALNRCLQRFGRDLAVEVRAVAAH